MTLGYLKIEDDEVYITRRFLTDNFVSNIVLQIRMGLGIEEGCSEYVHFIDKNTGEIWINYKTIPDKHLSEYGLPQSDQKLVEILCEAVDQAPQSFNPYLIFLFYIIWDSKQKWSAFVPHYTPYYLEIEQCRRLAKTHAIIQEILFLKRLGEHSIKDIYHAYMQMPKVTCKVRSLNYFYRKIREFEKEPIHEVLMHKFKVKGREPYKITESVEAIIKRHYISNKRYSISMIHKLTNLKLVSLGKSKISRSTVSRVCNSPNFKNRADMIRYGRKYTEDYLLPYLKRKKVEKAGALYEIDGKDLRIKCIKNDQVVNLFITAVLDVFSGKIVGYHLGDKEDVDSVMCALKMAFQESRIIPEYIFYDNHVAVPDLIGTLG